MENETDQTGTAEAATAATAAPTDATTAAADATPPLPPDVDVPAPQDIALGLWDQLLASAEGLWRPSVAWQILIVAALFLVAHLASAYLKPRWEGWLRTREGWPTWRMRLGILIHRRMRRPNRAS